MVGSFTDPNTLGTVGGFKVERYVDSTGRECAYYDTTLLFPTDVTDALAGVNVLDMSDPAHPKLTDTLISPAMVSPHESLVVSQKRGLIVAVAGNPAFAPGIVDVYDASADCRDPVLRSSTPMGVFGHESGLSPDGKTFYSASPGTETIVAVDISNPSLPVPLGYYNYDSHGLSIGDDGNRAYVAGINSGLIILDTSEIQARVPGPERQRDSAPDVGLDEHPAERDPDHDRRAPLRRRDRRVRRRVGGRRGADHRHRRRGQPAGDLEPPPRGPPARELPHDRRRSGHLQPDPGLRRPLLQRARPASTPRSSPAA